MLGPEVSDWASSTRFKSSPSVGERCRLHESGFSSIVWVWLKKESSSSAIFGAVVTADDMFEGKTREIRVCCVVGV